MADATPRTASGPAEPDYGLFDRTGISWEMVFRPGEDPTAPPEGASDLRIEVEPATEVAARFYALGRGYPTVLLFHGNGEVIGHHDRFVHVYHEGGLNLFVAEYRGYGKSDGTPGIAHLVADAHPIAAAFHAFLDEQGFDRRRVVMGRSLGSFPALEIAARAPAGFVGMVIESGGAMVRRLLDRSGYPDNGDGWRLVEAHEARIRSIRLQTIQLHGELDDQDSLAELYLLLEGAASRRMCSIANAGHNNILWQGRPHYMSLIREFIDGRASAGE